MYDDSVGIRVANHLENCLNYHRAGIFFVDLSNRVFDLISYCDNKTSHIVIVDTGRLGLDAGDYKVIRLEQARSSKKRLPKVSVDVHSTDLFKVLDFARTLYKELPIIDLLIIEPKEIKLAEGISNDLARKIDEYSKIALAALERA
ncbi:MAG: hypothetical protein A2504_12195 [Bdellovibrionales bacterium RIFOXYD12_FULL_39_22]|nr:MAG: hypothetical protein A2385_14045 [Bdellovibrionales bacterium RIFOXYB1_FULL_39_21]OFZ42524.1 MAG: hypothetical protein A2485_03555 [Bdellovibrionales bacterium RIFOXYC12_FULL_39_17]OFZ45802.1 MAG: hypothetical protein A2404_02270 [Bdellovibrionales bacterium RIFOXYC1_FULL_39_130]OFZ74736.1 MAG: hypothetical protein A2560_05200 [Bdellovibrionales bacterium RIFOXYD1_FULL_39_84]OFZ93115.1 MAG: hypothetical protein A2504_12195 [Bdellovibrionales bacterium RIFOXYD12_FULL_39_22]